jgi:uncharacterized phage protein (TIGR01671 family)
VRDYKFRAWHAANKRMFKHKELGVLLKNVGDDTVWKYMQYIGLKDKNGVEIFEGDHIEGNLIPYSPLPTMGIIEYSSENACFGNRNESGFTFLSKIDDIVVIGNKFESPELLKGEI